MYAELVEVSVSPQEYGFRLSAPSKTKNYKISVSASDYHGRETFVKIPGSKAQSSSTNVLKVALVPQSFSMTDLNEMVRGVPDAGLLKRVENSSIYGVAFSRRILQFRTNDTHIVQSGQIGSTLSPFVLNNNMSFLAEALTNLTPWTYSVGESIIDFEPFVGQELMPLWGRGVSVVIYSGLRSSSGAYGAGSWRVVGGKVINGHAMIDSEVMSNRNILLHEVGHCFGYNHVGVAVSAMNNPTPPTQLTTPTDFDVKASKILFTRSIGNTNVDRDSPNYTLGIDYPELIGSTRAGEDDVLDFTVGCFDDGTESLDIYRVMVDGSRVRIGGHERRSM